MSGYGNLWVANVASDSLYNDETYVGKPEKDTENTENKHETYILNRQNKSIMNKIIKTKVGDEIHYFVNGQENHGVVAKMSASFVTIFKEDGKFYEVPLNDTFFVKDILVNKSWNDMSMEERTEQLQKAKAYSPRFLGKTWEQLPKELQTVLQKATGAIPKPEVNPTKTLPQASSMQSRTAQAASTVPSPDDESEKDKYAVGHLEQSGGVRGKSPLAKALEQLEELKKNQGVVEAKRRTQHSGAPQIARRVVTGTADDKERRRGAAGHVSGRWTRGFVDDEFQGKKDERNIKEGMEALGKLKKALESIKSGHPTKTQTEDRSTFRTTPQGKKITESKEFFDEVIRAPSSVVAGYNLNDNTMSSKELRNSQGRYPKGQMTMSRQTALNNKSDVEQGVYGNVAGRPTNGLSTDTKVDAPKDYEGHSHEGIRLEQFKYEDKKPKVDDDHKTKAGEFVYTDNPEQYKTKSIGVPEVQQNTWGIKYVTKEEREKLQSKD